MEKTALTPNLTVEIVLQQWPETVSVFQAFKTSCVGCAMAPFDTIEDVTRIYHLELGIFMNALREQIEKGQPEGHEM